MKQTFGLLSLLLLCIYLIFNNSAISQINSNSEYLETDAPVQNDQNANDEVSKLILPEFEYIHQKDEDQEVDGYIVETYREYEIYKDQFGNIIKQVPTSNFDYIKYKK
ncbi:hypothetical protein V7201_15430 [Bacillus sp. JJ1122]|uniref:hypothetical protein n=1 Tax=Bacillus sp. JJ1122 TaxID=3122951 RepID=UPI00300035EC